MPERRRSRARTLAFALVTATGSTVACLLVLEAALRFLPVSSGIRIAAVNAAQPVFRAVPDQRYTHSKYGFLDNPNRGRVNNAGFVNDQDYDPGAVTPLLAVIGDSYVEAVMVPYPETLQGRLAAASGAAARVYSFAFSGAPLSQYLAWMDFAERSYRPEAFVVVVIGNDIDESLARYKRAPGFHHYVEGDGGDLALRLFEYRPNPLRELVYRSALARYLVFNLQVLDQLPGLLQSVRRLGAAFAAGSPDYVGSTAARAGEERLGLSERVIDAFFRDLPCVSALPADRISFVVEGIREAVYGELDATSAAHSYWGRVRELFMARARARGHPVVDLQEAFVAHFAGHRQRFEFDSDWHWNGVGHQVAADAVRGGTLFGSLAGLRRESGARTEPVPGKGGSECGIGVLDG